MDERWWSTVEEQNNAKMKSSKTRNYVGTILTRKPRYCQNLTQ